MKRPESTPDGMTARQKRKETRLANRLANREARIAQQDRQGITRLGLFSLGATVIIGALTLAARHLGGSTSKETTTPTATPDNFVIAKKEFLANKPEMDRIIAEAEAGIQELKALVNPSISSEFPNPRIQEILRRPFQVMEANEQNPQKNLYVFLLNELQKQQSQGSKEFQFPTTYLTDQFFQYGSTQLGAMITADNPNVATYFDLTNRTLYLRRNILRGDRSDSLSIYHELRHIDQDRRARLGEYGIDYAKIDDLRKTDPNIIVIDFELEAIAAELTLADLLTGGRFSTDMRSGKIVTTQEYARLLNHNPSLPGLPFLLEQGSAYFRSNSTPAEFQPLFRERVNGIYRFIGREPYNISQGNLVKSAA